MSSADFRTIILIISGILKRGSRIVHNHARDSTVNCMVDFYTMYSITPRTIIDAQKMKTYQNNPEWKLFFPAEIFVKTIEQIVREEYIPFKQTSIHLDIYEQSKKSPVIVYCHGLSSSGRMMANFALPLFQKGYTVICPDLPGFGISPDNRGSIPIPELAEALKAVVMEAHKYSNGTVYLTGISLGGTLTYYATCLGAPVTKIACLNLLNMADEINLNATHRPWLISKLKKLVKLISGITPETSLPLQFFLNPDRLSSQKSIVDQFKTNPLVVKAYTLRALNSLLSAAPTIPFDQFDLCPILVMHGDKDELIPEWITKANFDLIKGEKKYVTLKGGEHIPLNVTAFRNYINELANWFLTY